MMTFVTEESNYCRRGYFFPAEFPLLSFYPFDKVLVFSGKRLQLLSSHFSDKNSFLSVFFGGGWKSPISGRKGESHHHKRL